MPVAADFTLWVRDNPITSAENSANDVKNTFSSWDACMSKAYCKWPVIVAIIIASLILLSIISCLVRCLCCGLECCCGCFKCFNACCECCTPRRNRQDKYRDEPPAFNSHNPYGGYQPPPAAPTYIIQQPAAAPPPQRYEPSRQYASFDTMPAAKRSMAGSTAHEDSLPAMPTWKDAQTGHAQYEEEEVEMDQLNPHQAQQAAMLAHQAPNPVNRNAPMPGAQTEGMGLYNDTPTHHADSDLGAPYSHDPAMMGGAAAAAGGAAAGYAAHNAYQQHHASPPPQQQYGYSSPPAHNPYVSPESTGQHGAASSYFGQASSPPPPSYHTAPANHGGYGVTSPVSPPNAAAGLPAALTPGGGIQPAHQAYGQESGVVGGGYNAYQSNSHGYRDV